MGRGWTFRVSGSDRTTCTGDQHRRPWISCEIAEVSVWTTARPNRSASSTSRTSPRSDASALTSCETGRQDEHVMSGAAAFREGH